jgi:hypothetical protein
MHWSVETGLLSREAADWLDARYRAYQRGEVSEIGICGEMVQVYQGLREEEVRRAAARFFAEKIERNIFPEMLEVVTALEQRGTEIWAVSSTNDWVVEEGVRRFNIPASRVLCTRVVIADGVVTDRRGEGGGAGRGRRGCAGCGLRQLDPRRGDACDRPPGLPCEPVAGSAGAGGGGRLARVSSRRGGSWLNPRETSPSREGGGALSTLGLSIAIVESEVRVTVRSV